MVTEVSDSAEIFFNLAESDFAPRWYTKLPPHADGEPPSDAHAPCTKEENIRQIHQTFDPAIEAIHGLRRDGSPCGTDGGGMRTAGRTWAIDPAYGKGEYWYTIVDSDMILVSMQGELESTAVISGYSTNLVGFGLYSGDMPAYFAENLEPQQPTLLGYVWKNHRYRQVVEKHTRFRSCSISFLPSALQRMAEELGTEAEKLIEAMVMLDGYRDLPKVSAALQEFEEARPSAATAPAYYRAKAVECLALLVDGNERYSRNLRVLSQEDTRLCSAVARYARANLARDLSTRSLCRAFHVSETKMIGAFRDAMGKTPQEYVRKQRMEYARGLLAGTSMNVRQIASTVGYTNQGAFAEAFKAHCDMTPSRYRAERRDEGC